MSLPPSDVGTGNIHAAELNFSTVLVTELQSNFAISNVSISQTCAISKYSQTCVKQPARGSGQTGRLPQVASEYRCGKC